MRSQRALISGLLGLIVGITVIGYSALRHPGADSSERDTWLHGVYALVGLFLAAAVTECLRVGGRRFLGRRK